MDSVKRGAGSPGSAGAKMTKPRLFMVLLLLAVPSCVSLSPTIAPLPLDAVVRSAAKQVTLCDSGGCVSLTRAQLMAVARDL